MKTRNDRRLTEDEKQRLPLPGEASLEDAERMVQHFATVEALRLALVPDEDTPAKLPLAPKK